MDSRAAERTAGGLLGDPSPIEHAAVAGHGEQLGIDGETAGVFLVAPGVAVKLYHDPLGDAGPVQALVDWREGLGEVEREFLDSVCAWPRRLVMDGASVAGFLMATAPSDFFHPMEGQQHLVELQHLLYRRTSPVGAPDEVGRLSLAWHLAHVFDFFEHHGLVYGDVSEVNVLWSPTRPPRVFLLDCDNARFASRPAAGAAVPKLGAWRDPWADMSLPPSIEADRFALGMFFYKAYYLSSKHFDQDNQQILIPEGIARVAALDELLARSMSNRLPRPSAGIWAQALAVALADRDAPAPRSALTETGWPPKPTPVGGDQSESQVYRISNPTRHAQNPVAPVEEVVINVPSRRRRRVRRVAAMGVGLLAGVGLLGWGWSASHVPAERVLVLPALTASLGSFPRGDQVTVAWSEPSTANRTVTRLLINGEPATGNCPATLQSAASCTFTGRYNTTYVVSVSATGDGVAPNVLPSRVVNIGDAPAVSIQHGRAFNLAGVKFCGILVSGRALNPNTRYTAQITETQGAVTKTTTYLVSESTDAKGAVVNSNLVDTNGSKFGITAGSRNVKLAMAGLSFTRPTWNC